MKSKILALLELDETSEQVLESLKRIDRRATICKKFTEAIKKLEKSSYALIISDVHLENGGNVFDFLRWTKANPMNKDTPFVLLSCQPTKMAKYVEDGVRTTARLLGADLFLTYEQFDPVSFCLQIEALITAKHQSDKLATRTSEQNEKQKSSLQLTDKEEEEESE